MLRAKKKPNQSREHDQTTPRYSAIWMSQVQSWLAVVGALSASYTKWDGISCQKWPIFWP
jgi:hypothetical protein